MAKTKVLAGKFWWRGGRTKCRGAGSKHRAWEKNSTLAREILNMARENIVGARGEILRGLTTASVLQTLTGAPSSGMP